MEIDSIYIKKYSIEYYDIWDNFVNNNLFGTIYHTRKFLDYHPKNRFQDTSILMYFKEELICVLPCCYINNKYFSHPGSTYGGPVILRKYSNIKYLNIIISKIFEYYQNNIEFRIANNIYFDESIFDLYYLLSSKLRMCPELSWYYDTENNFINSMTNKDNIRVLKKMIKNDNYQCYITDNINDYIEFHKILSETLKIKHNCEPTHNLKELLLLKDILKNKQLLYVCMDLNENKMLGGIYIIKVNNKCWYTVYMTQNSNLKNLSIIYLIYTIINDASNQNIKYIDYGITTENRGTKLNLGLSCYKQKTLAGKSNSRFLFIC